MVALCAEIDMFAIMTQESIGISEKEKNSTQICNTNSS